jgi:hypothetical protein
MHEKYAKKGLVCMSISVDDVDDQDRTLTFLKKQKATFANYLLDEPAKVWKDYFDIVGPPTVLVYDRSGKLAGKFDDYADVEKLVEKLLDSK